MGDRFGPWRTLARITGPLMLWLSLSFVLLYLLLGNEWILNSLGESGTVEETGLLVRGLISAFIGLPLIAWGYTGETVAYAPAVVRPGKSVCPNCGAELLGTTTVCPYCGKDFGTKQNENPKAP